MALPKNNNQPPLPGSQKPQSFGSNRGSAPPPQTTSAGDGFFSEFDLENAQAGGGSRLENGWYDVDIATVEPGLSSGGYKQLTVHFVVAEGDNEGRKHREWITVTDNTLWRVKQFLEACGIPDGQMRGLKLSDLQGAALWILIGDGNRTNQSGQPYGEVKEFRISQRNPAYGESSES